MNVVKTFLFIAFLRFSCFVTPTIIQPRWAVNRAGTLLFVAALPL